MGGYVKSNDLNRKKFVGDSSSDSEPQGRVIRRLYLKRVNQIVKWGVPFRWYKFGQNDHREHAPNLFGLPFHVICM